MERGSTADRSRRGLALNIELHPAAEAEARAARVRYASSDRAIGGRVVTALDRALERIAEQPDRWPVYLHGTRRVLVRRFPFAIICVDATRVLVVATAHQRR